MKQGKRLKTIRCHRSMTMKQLGMALGFDESTAAIRVAQYESDTRSPKPDVHSCEHQAKPLEIRHFAAVA